MHKKKEEGAIIIEATIALTTFMFVVVIILSLINICLVQSRVATLTHSIAKDVSNYSYLYKMTGLGEKEASLSNDASYAKHSLDEVIENSSKVYDTVEHISSLSKDTEFWTSAVAMIKEAAVNGVKGGALNTLCKDTAKKRLRLSGEDADTFLHRMGITDGVDGLDFSRSEFCVAGGDDIKIICKYKVHALRLLNIDYDFNFMQCAVTKAWACPAKGSTGNSGASVIEGDSENSNNVSESDEDSIEAETKTQNGSQTVEETQEDSNKSLAELVDEATQNPNSRQVMLGRYTSYYDGVARNYGMTFFEMDENEYNQLVQEGRDWDANRLFLENQYSQGKEFFLLDDPYTVESGAYYEEVEWLRRKGYTFEKIHNNEREYWKAVPDPDFKEGV